MKRTWKQRAAAAGAGVMLVGAGLAAVPGTSHAAASTAQARQAATCHQEGDSYFDIDVVRISRVTHLGGYQIPPGVSVSKTRSVQIEARLKGSVSSNAGADASITTKVLGKVGVNVNVAVAIEGEMTTKYGESVTWTVPRASKDRYYALYSARRSYEGGWSYFRCEGDFWHMKAQGEFKTFGYTKLEGGALCTVGRTKQTRTYAKGSLPYRACQGTWW